ncbi:hypothetical protein [Azospirillum canadense]|uniref:hypothetical protein n=1 Tax=Azospirillum canadense TaxID=403962 RepID=UPI002225CDD2|nr:hypothetical protein [Azospirillum canadense]MCW2237848.1 hypothetical protein [Azospirillum canadense]
MTVISIADRLKADTAAQRSIAATPIAGPVAGGAFLDALAETELRAAPDVSPDSRAQAADTVALTSVMSGPVVNGLVEAAAGLGNGVDGMEAGASSVRGVELGKLFPKVHFAELLKAKTAALTEAMNRRFAVADVDTSVPVQLDIASDGRILVRGDHPDKAKIERLFAEDPDFADQYREVAGAQAFLAAGRVTERFQLELDDTETEEERKRVYRRFEPIFQQLERIGGQMTLAGGSLSSAAVDMASALTHLPTWALTN